MESLKEFFWEALETMIEGFQEKLMTHNKILRDLNGELFLQNVVGGQEEPEWDAEKAEEEMVLEHWREWGVEGTGFEHLPVLKRDQLYRADPEEEYEGSGGEDEEEVEDEEGEDEDEEGEEE